MGDWSYLSTLLDKVQSHSTVVGKVWMSVLFLFRILVLGAAADGVWGDEHSEFYCNTEEPGCRLACYNWLFPISYVRYWTLQIVAVTTPTLVYLAHAVHVVHREKRLRQQLSQTEGTTNPLSLVKHRQPRYTDERGKVTIKGVLLRSYLLQLLCKILLEVAFSVGQLYLYSSAGGGEPSSSLFIADLFHCQQSPCPGIGQEHRGIGPIGAECYVSRPTEKTIFIIFMLVVSGVSVLLNVLEVVYLLCARRRANQKKRTMDYGAKLEIQQQQHQHPSMASSPAWPSSVNNRHGASGGPGLSMQPLALLPQDLVDICNDNSCIDLVDKEKCT